MSFKRIWWLFTLGMLSALPAMAQVTATPASKLAWDQGATNLAEANSLGASLYVDAAATGVPVTGKTCVGPTSPFQCTSNIGALTQGAHTLTITATLAGAESAKSNSINITMVIIVTPAGLHLVQQFDTMDDFAQWLATPQGRAAFGLPAHT